MSSTSAPVIAAVILTLNEEETIARALESLDWCNELHVVDSGSTDGTIEKAQALGARVYTHPQEGPFVIAEQRNWALDNIESSAEWVLFLDADEIATPEFSKAVVEACAEPAATSLMAAPAFYFQGTWLKRSSGFPNWHPRGVRLGSAQRFTGGVWEAFLHDDGVRQIRAPYAHYVSEKGARAWIEKHLRYAEWESDQILDFASARAITPQRRRRLRSIRYRLGALRKWFAVSHLLFVRGGALDGTAAWRYARRMMVYELLIDVLLDEKRRIRRGMPL